MSPIGYAARGHAKTLPRYGRRSTRSDCTGAKTASLGSPAYTCLEAPSSSDLICRAISKSRSFAFTWSGVGPRLSAATTRFHDSSSSGLTYLCVTAPCADGGQYVISPLARPHPSKKKTVSSAQSGVAPTRTAPPIVHTGSTIFSGHTGRHGPGLTCAVRVGLAASRRIRARRARSMPRMNRFRLWTSTQVGRPSCAHAASAARHRPDHWRSPAASRLHLSPPPPPAPPRAGALDGRIRREVVLEMRKR